MQYVLQASTSENPKWHDEIVFKEGTSDNKVGFLACHWRKVRPDSSWAVIKRHADGTEEATDF